MKTVIFKCDKCGKETKDEKIHNEWKHVFVGIGSSSYAGHAQVQTDLELCPACLEKLGLIKRIVKDSEIVNEVQDVKDKLYDVMCQLIEEAGIQVEY